MKQQITSVLGITSDRNTHTHTFNTKLAMSIIILILVSIAFTSCNNYPKGSILSFTSKKNRVTNEWKNVKALENSTDITSNYNKYELNLSKDGNAKLIANYKFLGVDFDFETNGTWAFMNDSKKIYFNYDNDSADGIYQILKLEKNEMWLKKEGEALELHYVTQ